MLPLNQWKNMQYSRSSDNSQIKWKCYCPHVYNVYINTYDTWMCIWLLLPLLLLSFAHAFLCISLAMLASRLILCCDCCDCCLMLLSLLSHSAFVYWFWLDNKYVFNCFVSYANCWKRFQTCTHIYTIEHTHTHTNRRATFLFTLRFKFICCEVKWYRYSICNIYQYAYWRIQRRDHTVEPRTKLVFSLHSLPNPARQNVCACVLKYVWLVLPLFRFCFYQFVHIQLVGYQYRIVCSIFLVRNKH